jgi:hypothetical protein
MTIWLMRVSCWISKYADTHSQRVTYTDSYGKNDYAKAPRYYVIRTLPVLASPAVTFEVQTTSVSTKRISG